MLVLFTLKEVGSHDLVIEFLYQRNKLLHFLKILNPPLRKGAPRSTYGIDALLHGIVLHVDVGEVAASLQVVQLVEVLDIIALEVEHCQVLYEAYVEQLVDLIVADVQLLELLECLDALDFFELTSAKMEDAHVLERRADVSEGRNNRIIELEVLKAGEDFTRHLQIVEPRIDTQLNLRQQCQVRLVNTPKLLHKELFIEINDILNLLSLNNLKQLLLDILKSINILNLTLLLK